MSTETSADKDPVVAGIELETKVRYRLSVVKGQGGLGEVWVGRDLTMDRDVAVKRIRPHVRSADVERRFLQEARVTGQLQHPNIIPVYELGADGGEPFYSMRLVQGRTLQQEIADYHGRIGPNTVDRVALTKFLDVFLKAAQAIAYAHDSGVLHRDLKPENIMVGEFGEVVVLDWGLAKVTRGSVEVDLSLKAAASASGADDDVMAIDSQTRAGSVLGSPLYMAPEQAGGNLAKIDARTDVYGLGGILYECLTGRPPHPPVEKRSIKGHLLAIQNEEVEPARHLVPRLPRSLNAIVVKALVRQPDRRYQTASALIDDIQRFLAGEPVSAMPETWISHLARWSGRHRLAMMSMSMAIFVFIVVATIFTTLDAQGRHSEREHQITALRQRLKNAADQTAYSMQWITAGMRFLRDVLPPMFDGVRFRTRADVPPKTLDEVSDLLLAFLRSDPEFLEFAIVPATNLDEESIRVVEDIRTRIVRKIDKRSDPFHPRELLRAALRSPNETHFGDMQPLDDDQRRYVIMSAATAIQHDNETIAIVVARVVLADYFFNSVISLARSDDAFAQLFDDSGRSLLFVSPQNEMEYASGVQLRDAFPKLFDDISRRPENQIDDTFGGLYDEGIVLADEVYFDPARPSRHLTLVFGKNKSDLYAPLVRVYTHVGYTAIITMAASLAALLFLSWLLLRSGNRWN